MCVEFTDLHVFHAKMGKQQTWWYCWKRTSLSLVSLSVPLNYCNVGEIKNLPLVTFCSVNIL